MHTTTVGAFARRLLTVAELDLYGTPLPPVGPILEYRFSVHLAAHDDVAQRALVNKSKLGTPLLSVGASGFLCCARDFYGEDDGEEDAIVWRADGVIEEIEPPYDGAPEGTLPRFKIKFSDGATAMAKLGMLRFPEEAKRKRSRSRRRDRRRSRSRKRDRAAPRSRRGPATAAAPVTAAAGPLPRPLALAESRPRAAAAGAVPLALAEPRPRTAAPCAAAPPRSPRRFRPPSRDRSREYRPARSPPPRRRGPSPRWRDRGRSPPRGSPRRRRSR